MLVRFSFGNFRSYKDQAVFSMAAGKITRHGGHVCECGGHRLLRSAFVFGANAGGKSNFVKALDFGRRMVLGGEQAVSLDKQYFRLGRRPNPIGFFQYDIFADGDFYSYGFAVNYFSGAIIEEWLSRLSGKPGKKDVSVFHRRSNESGQISIERELELPEQDGNRFDIYAEDFKNPAMQRELFLRDVGKRAAATEFGKAASTVLKWFQKMLVIYPETQYTGIPFFMMGRKKNESFSRLMGHFDTGIESLEEEVVAEEKIWEQFPPPLREKIKADIVRDLADKPGQAAVTIHDGTSSFLFTREATGDLVVKKTKENHGNHDDLFDREDESDGTIRLFDLVPLYDALRGGGVVVVDELDRSLHTKATLEFIRIFLEDKRARRGQLIATTHDGNLLDLDVLRQDEIWFAERGRDNSTKLEAFLKFKIRFDKDIHKDYLLGRYGALPLFDVLDDARQDADGERNR